MPDLEDFALMMKTAQGNYFEDFEVGQLLRHATPRTVTTGDVALYTALYGCRFAVQSSDEFARSIGYEQSPIDDLLTFHMVFGKTVAEISLNAVANLGYADCRFLVPVYPGDTLTATSKVIGVKQTSSGKTGIVWVRSKGENQRGEPVLEYVRWVMVRKRQEGLPSPEPVIPELPDHVAPGELAPNLPGIKNRTYDFTRSGAPFHWDDYKVGEKIDHVDAMTLEEAEHQLATRLYQNTAKVHFNAHAMRDDRFGKRLIYGGHIISMARALSFNGLANAFHLAAINGGRHVAPCFAGDTVYAWSQVLDSVALPDRSDVGALRLRTIATKDCPCNDFPDKDQDGKYAEGIVLDLDYWVVLPR